MKLSTPSPLAQQHALQARTITFVLFTCLLCAIAADHFVLRDASHWQVWLLQTAPLFLTVPGMLKLQARSGIWLCFMLMFYFLLYVGQSASELHRTVYIGLSLLVLALFTTALLFSRWQAQADRMRNEALSTLSHS